ncbi:MAG: D-glycerate dehydrogenase [Myxococcota bacterium]|nr:D-glycerate dehydrogenase [Myxococcota bacterium]
MTKRVFVTRRFPGPGLSMLKGTCDVDLWPSDLPPTRAELLAKVDRIDGLLCLLTDTIDAEMLDAAGPQLRVISNYAVGFDNIDVALATARGIPVGNTPGVLTEATADFAFSLLMAAARRLGEGIDFARAGKWQTWSPGLLLGGDVHGATLGILGMGRIGQAMARRARGFEMQVLYCDPSHTRETIEGARSVAFKELLEQSDYLSVHTPLNAQTHHLFDGNAFQAMKSTAVLINTARGPIVDHGALHGALEAGQIAYAALDVTEPEPLPPTHPLFSLENCLILPHLGSATNTTRAKMGIMACENLLAGLQGNRLPNCVNPQLYDM